MGVQSCIKGPEVSEMRVGLRFVPGAVLRLV